eukprot:12423218-Karenia_brevis.AAC.1
MRWSTQKRFWTDEGWKKLKRDPTAQLRNYIKEVHGNEILMSLGEMHHFQMEMAEKEKDEQYLRCYGLVRTATSKMAVFRIRSGTLIENEAMRAVWFVEPTWYQDKLPEPLKEIPRKYFWKKQAGETDIEYIRRLQ